MRIVVAICYYHSESLDNFKKNEMQLNIGNIHIIDYLKATWPRGYKTFFMLNSTENEIFFANKYENAKNSSHFHIY